MSKVVIGFILSKFILSDFAKHDTKPITVKVSFLLLKPLLKKVIRYYKNIQTQNIIGSKALLY